MLASGCLVHSTGVLEKKVMGSVMMPSTTKEYSKLSSMVSHHGLNHRI